MKTRAEILEYLDSELAYGIRDNSMSAEKRDMYRAILAALSPAQAPLKASVPLSLEGQEKRCKKIIQVGHLESTYCVLADGHVGACSTVSLSPAPAPLKASVLLSPEGKEKPTVYLDSYYEWCIEKMRARLCEAQGTGGDLSILMAAHDSLLTQVTVEITGTAYRELTKALSPAQAPLKELMDNFRREINRITRLNVDSNSSHTMPTLTAVIFLDKLEAVVSDLSPHQPTSREWSKERITFSCGCQIEVQMGHRIVKLGGNCEVHVVGTERWNDEDEFGSPHPPSEERFSERKMFTPRELEAITKLLHAEIERLKQPCMCCHEMQPCQDGCRCNTEHLASPVSPGTK